MVNSLWRSEQETFSPVLQTRGGQAERRAETCATGAGGSETGAHLSRRDEQRSQQSGTSAQELGFCQCRGSRSDRIQIRSDPELVGQFGFGIIVPEPGLTFLTRKSVKVQQIFLQNGPNFLLSHTTIFLYKIFKMLTVSLYIKKLPMTVFSLPGVKVRARIRNDLKRRIRIRTKSP